MKNFNAKKKADEVISWIRNYFNKEENKNCYAVVGVSGGCDSSVVLKLCTEALGAYRVIAVLMPNGVQNDIHYSYAVCDKCAIPQQNRYEININTICDVFEDTMEEFLRYVSSDKLSGVLTNYPARIRMSILYAVAAIHDGRVINTNNLSEEWVGYSTKFGDSAGDLAPIANFTKTEVIAMGTALKLPRFMVNKVPSDGLCGKTDEEKLGFTYNILDRYIRTKECDNEDIKKNIDELHYANIHKLKSIPKFYYRPDKERKEENDESKTSGNSRE